MDKQLNWQYDHVGDILYLTKVMPYPEQDEDEIDDGIVARFHPHTGAIESLEILFFTARLRRGETLRLPLGFTADIRQGTAP